MSVTGIQHGYMWARHFKGAYDYSVTVQVHNRDATCEVALNGAWMSEPPHTSWCPCQNNPDDPECQK